MNDAAFADAYFAKATRTLASARHLIAVDDAEGACDRAYYAIFDAVHAALCAAGFGERTAAIKIHSGFLSFFGQNIIGTERIASEYGRAIDRAGRLRTAAGHLLDLPSVEEAIWAVQPAEELLDAVRTMKTS